MKKADVLELLVRSVYQLWRSCLLNTQQSHQLYSLMSSPEVGDVVMEVTTAAFIEGHINSIGKLVAIERGSSDIYDVYIIKRLFDDKIFRWSNCQFVRVPDGKRVALAFGREGKAPV